MDWIESLEPHFIWLAIGLLLGAAEILVPGVFLIWLAGAALLTAFVGWLFPIPVPLQIVHFAVLSIAAVFVGRRYLRANPIEDVDPKMNRRGDRMVGQSGVAVQGFEGGEGRVKIGDSEWLARVEGDADIASGARVKVTGSDGTVMLVEPV